MKSTERHKMKENEFAQTVARTRDIVNERPRETATIAIAVLAVALAVGGFFAWKARITSHSHNSSQWSRGTSALCSLALP